MSEIKSDNLSNEFLYTISSLMINGVEIDSKYFSTLVTRKNFYNYRFPVKVMTLTLPFPLIYKIVEGIDISRPLVEVTYTMNVHIEDRGEGQPIKLEKKKYIGMIDNTYLNYVNYVDDLEDQEISPYRDEKEIRIGLFARDDLQSFRYGYVNNVFKNFNVATLITKGYGECTDGGLNLFLSPPDNKQVYRQDLIVPMGFFEFIRYVDDNMGIYDTDYNVYIEDGDTYIINKDNEHGIVPSDESIEDVTKEVHVDSPFDISSPIGAEISDGKMPPKRYKIKNNSLTHLVENEVMGRYDEFYSDIHNLYFTPGEENHSLLNTNKILSKRFKKHKRKKSGVIRFLLSLDNLPFKAKPYHYIRLLGQGTDLKGMNQLYRITEYLNVISNRQSFTRVNLKRLTDKM